MIILCFFAEMIVCFVASAVRRVCRFLLSVRCGGVVVFMLCLLIYWLCGVAVGSLAGYSAGYSACLLAVCLGACAGLLGDY